MPEITADSSVTSPPSYAIYDDPFYLSPTDQPSLKLLSYLFNGKNFTKWKRDVYLAHITKNKDGFMDGVLKTPAKTDRSFNQYVRCDLFVAKWILYSIEPEIRESLDYIHNARELWLEINERYGQANGLEVYQLKKDLGHISQDNSSLIEYYSKLKTIWDSLASLDPVPLCSCGALDQCTFHLLKRMLDRESNAKFIQFIMGLNNSYEMVNTNILSMEPLPSINKALSLLQKIERQKQIIDVVEVLAEATAYSTSTQQPEWKKAKLNPPSHKLEHCYIYKNKGKGKSWKGKGKVTFQNGENVYRRNANNAKTLDSDDEDETADYTPFTSHSEPAFPPDMDKYAAQQSAPLAFDSHMMNGLVQTVVKQVVQAFSETQSPPAVSHINFVDTGASDHMTSKTDVLLDIKILLKPIIVSLPDGTIKVVHRIGKACVAPNIILDNVLIVPDFKQNLLSVGKLIGKSNIVVSFNTTECVFQDLTSKVILGVAKKCGDLYWLKSYKAVNKASSSLDAHFPFHDVSSNMANCSRDLRHKMKDLHVLHARLGHTSIEQMKHVLNLPYSDVNGFFCETCI
ncbi:uncharacterized protein LOC141627786 [Silene latifolia]|uniref:uncharacterized protein LOC141627786 n=1 Tax=Silene latifolia TaxID=37657 RepID=UPI003D7758CF